MEGQAWRGFINRRSPPRGELVLSKKAITQLHANNSHHHHKQHLSLQRAPSSYHNISQASVCL